MIVRFWSMIFAAAIALAAAPAASAHTAEARADAEAIVAASGFEEQLESSLAIMTPLVSASLLGGFAAEPNGGDILAAIDAGFPGGRTGFAERFTSEFVEKFRLRFPEARRLMVDYLLDNMSPANLAEVRRFLESDSGRAYSALSVPMQNYMSQQGERIGGEVAMAVVPDLLDFLTKGQGAK